MQAGGVATREVYSVSGRVLVNGTDNGAHVRSVSVSRDIPEGLPGSSSAFQSASADVVAVFGDDVSSRVPHPWEQASGLPKTGDAVEIWLSDGANEWRQIKGHLEEPAGSTGTREVTFTVVDRYQPLNRPVNIPALSNSMPALTDANDARYIGMLSTYLVDSALRQAGRYCTPPAGNGCFVSVPFQGSAWPERGTVTHSIKQTADETGGAYPNWRVSAYGRSVHNLEALYDPWSWSGLDLAFNRPMELTQEIVPMSGGSTFLRVRAGAGHVAIAQAGSSVTARYFPSTGSFVNLATVPKGSATRVSIRYSKAGSVLSAEIRLRNADGSLSSISTGTATIVSGDLAGSVDQIWANGAGEQGAFQAGYPSTAWATLGYTPNAVIHADVSANGLTGVPPQINQNSVELLQKIAEAELASWWIDENDVLQWWDRGVFRNGPSVATLTGADHVKEIPWEHSLGSLRRSAHLDYRSPTVTTRWRTNLTLWEGGGDALSQGDTEETIINVPDDEIWLGVDYANPIRYSQDTPNYYLINRGIRSAIGGIAIGADGTERQTNSVIPGLRRIDDATFATTASVAALFVDEQASLQFPSGFATDTLLWPKWWNQSLPILRGKKKIVFQDKRVTSATVGPVSAPDYEHNVDWLIQSDGYAQNTSDFVASLVTTAQPTIPSLDIMPVFNLQVGDVITVSDPEVMGISVRAIVIGNTISANFDTGEATQSLNLRPLAVTREGITWADFGAAKSGSAWSAWGTSRTGDTWAGFGANPLK